jgi:hypothetical protein
MRNNKNGKQGLTGVHTEQDAGNLNILQLQKAATENVKATAIENTTPQAYQSKRL